MAARAQGRAFLPNVYARQPFFIDGRLDSLPSKELSQQIFCFCGPIYLDCHSRAAGAGAESVDQQTAPNCTGVDRSAFEHAVHCQLGDILEIFLVGQFKAMNCCHAKQLNPAWLLCLVSPGITSLMVGGKRHGHNTSSANTWVTYAVPKIENSKAIFCFKFIALIMIIDSSCWA